jgi:hypothetical protein
MSVHRRLTVPIGRDFSTCIAQAYGGCFLVSSALRAGVVVTDRTRADPRNILHLLKRSSTGAAGGTSLAPVEFQHLSRRGMTELPSTAPVIQASPYSSEQTNLRLQVFHRASRTRTGDLLGAIQPLLKRKRNTLQRFSRERLERRSIPRNTLTPSLRKEEP